MKKLILHATAIHGGKNMSEFDVYDQEVKERWGNTEAYKESEEKTSGYTSGELKNFWKKTVVIFWRNAFPKSLRK